MDLEEEDEQDILEEHDDWLKISAPTISNDGLQEEESNQIRINRAK